MAFKADLQTAFTNNFDSATRIKIANAFCNQFNYTGPNTNPDKATFALNKIVQIIKDVVRAEDRRLQRASLPDPVEIVID